MVKHAWRAPLHLGILLATALCVCTAQAQAPADLPLLPDVRAMLADVQAGKIKADDIIYKGQERAVFCNSCHGPDGNSPRADYPSLAGQNADYLLDQIQQFADGRRNKSVMNELSAQFTSEDKVLLTVYYHLAPFKPAMADVNLAALGAKVYQGRCIGCHAVDGKGTQGYARLAGQQPDYVAVTLTHFRDGTGDRQSPAMRGVTSNLTDQEIKALAAYIANLR